MKNVYKSASLALAVVIPLSATAAVIDHDKVQRLPAKAPDFHFKFQPTLKVIDGCVPFPAVDAAGNTSAGLAPTGPYSSGCSKSVGQIYSRHVSYRGYCPVMYTWYFPKDVSTKGHRHDWENIVVWLTRCSTNATVAGISYSQHGGYYKTTKDLRISGTTPTVLYQNDGILADHILYETRDLGGSQWLVDASTMPKAAINALTTTNFGSANVSFKTPNFTNNLAKAYPF